MASNEGLYYLAMKRYCEDHQEEITRQINSLFTPFGDEKIIGTAQYLIAKTFDGFGEIEKPDYFDEYKECVLAGFIQDMSFFSSCWNYMVLEKNKVSIVPKKTVNQNNMSNPVLRSKTYSLGDRELIAAASEGMRKFGDEHIIENFGIFGQLCDNEDKEYQFYINLDDSLMTQKFRCEIEFTNANKKYTSVILSSGDGTKILHSDSIEVEDIYLGIRDLIIKIIFE